MAHSLIRCFADLEALTRAAADELVEQAASAISQRDRFTIALAGGSTPRGLYELLGESPYKERVAWEKAQFFWGDERGVSPDHPESNYRMTREALLKKLVVPENHVHRMQAAEEDWERAARNYQSEMARVFGVSIQGEPPRFDLVLLGLGADGHTASLFPSTAALKETNRWVVPNDVPQLESRRLTLTPRVFNQAHQIMFLVAGAEKAPALVRVLEGSDPPELVPAKLIRPAPDRCLWFVDREAAGLLRNSKGRFR